VSFLIAKSKNSSGNKLGIALRHETNVQPCATMSNEIKILMMKIVAKAKKASLKKRRLNSIDEEEDQIQTVETNSSKSQRQGIFFQKKK
ncbi:hypothetical protein CR513_51868, partial [Mucuna pruriens]